MNKILIIFALWIVGSHDLTIRGLSITPSTFFEIDYNFKSIDNMKGKKKTLSEIKSDFLQVHGDKYDYSLITIDNFINTSTKVPIICKKHGVFWQTPYSHLLGYGCKECGKKTQGGGVHLKKRKLVCNIGINDYPYPITKNGEILLSYSIWKAMLIRCYGKKNTETTYYNCSVCDEWHLFTTFKEWFDKNYIKGYHLDKDILFKGNKIYSPKTCCFVPPEINTLLVKHNATRGKLPIGVAKHPYIPNLYRAILRKKGIYIQIGVFNSSVEAFNAYKSEKEKHIKNMAEQYYKDGKIPYNVYLALLNYQVDIND